MLCILSNFDYFDWLISSLLQRLLVKDSSTPFLTKSFIVSFVVEPFHYQLTDRVSQKSVQYSSCYEVLKVETSFWVTRYVLDILAGLCWQQIVDTARFSRCNMFGQNFLFHDNFEYKTFMIYVSCKSGREKDFLVLIFNISHYFSCWGMPYLGNR